MTTRSVLFNRANLDTLITHNPFLLLFQKQGWKEYLELIAKIYDLIEEEGSRVPFDRVRSIIDTFYASADRAAVDQKRIEFISMAITQLAVLKDSHDGNGRRFIEATREGRTLLKFCEGFLLNRRKFTGTGADTLLGALNSLLTDHSPMSLDEAVASHRRKIREYQEDIERMRSHGVQSSELLSTGFSAEELFTQAEEAASHILAAGEDIKLAIETARKELVARYRNKDFSAGQAIEYIADYYETLWKTPEFSSFGRAKDLFSYIEGLGGKYDHKDISRIFHELRERHLVDPSLLTGSSLAGFSKKFQAIARDIDAKVQEQISILRAQVHYVIIGEGKRAQAELNELIGSFQTHESQVVEFLHGVPYSIVQGVYVELGELQLHALEADDSPALSRVELNAFESEEMARMIELLRQADEATIARVVQRLKETLSREGEVKLSDYALEHGIVEVYVLSAIENFSSDVAATAGPRIDLPVRAGEREIVLRNVQDWRYAFAC